MPQPNDVPEPLPQSERIYSYREWCARFLPHWPTTCEHAAFALWFQFVRSWNCGNN